MDTRSSFRTSLSSIDGVSHTTVLREGSAVQHEAHSDALASNEPQPNGQNEPNKPDPPPTPVIRKTL